MKPIWLVDDDPSIRFVLEKALARENLPTRSFTQPREVLEALADIAAGDPARQGLLEHEADRGVVIYYPDRLHGWSHFHWLRF